MRVTPLAFAVLLAVELALLHVARTARRPAVAFASRLAMFAVPLALALSLRAYDALTTPGILEWDETYYLSLAITAADGRGLYAFVFGYPEMPVMGGVGYAAYVHALAVKVVGPTILGLRAVSLAGAVAALAVMWFLVRAVYGSGAAGIAVALTATLRLFILSNSARMDSLIFAWVTVALLVTVVALRRGHRSWWHLLAGLAFGAGLQVHLDTVVTAVACGIVYLVLWAHRIRRERRLVVPAAALQFAAGWTAGLAAFILFNVLPDPEMFYRTTAQIRVDATGWYSGGTDSLLGSFLNPEVLLAKEAERYSVLWRATHPLESGLALAALGALLVRRTMADLLVLVTIGGVLLAGAIALNNASPLYFIHVMPALVLPLAALFSHGVRRAGAVSIRDLSSRSLAAFAVVISALCAVNVVRPAWRTADAPDPADGALAAAARAVVPRHCTVAGDADLYVEYFGDYPRFISARRTEVAYAMLVHDLRSEDVYWRVKAPDAVIMREVPGSLATYMHERGFVSVGEGVWLAPEGCGATPRRSTQNGT